MFMTAQQVADWLHIDRQLVYRLRKSGKLPGYQFGNQIRFKSTDVERFRDRTEDRNLPADERLLQAQALISKAYELIAEVEI